jgi:small subunit ribosomal protein S1
LPFQSITGINTLEPNILNLFHHPRQHQKFKITEGEDMTDNNQITENFTDLFQETGVARKQLSPGQKIQAEVVDITQDAVFLDVGEKSEGFVDRKELEDENGNVAIKPGDKLDVYFLSNARNEMLFTTKIGGGASSRAHLEEAYRSGIPLEGFVNKEIKGGFEVSVAGNIRTFCPYSQMDLKRISDPGEFIGQHKLFKITQFSEGGRNIVLSRRIILEEEREKKRDELKKNLNEGMTVRGKITSIKNFGAFVDVDGIEGLIPISEIGWSRTGDINEVLAVGQDVDVVILKLDWENERYSFSLKQALPDPWQDISQRFPVGSSHSGTIARLTKFGAFVNLAAGIDGLIHISKLAGGRRINHPREVLTEGQTVDVKIEDIDTEQKRLSLVMVAEMDDAQAGTAGDQDDTAEYMQKHDSPAEKTSLGTLGEILKAKLREKERK